eukprot:CAMPEP_0181169592 /NCGR_PEP_ID=MMETSP1096-20121128/897_1 /TAXON_ID=156174 ORGANISM="Chrysochromulina ericina, Strain CCMP281" /NCGR_SAMPLE_ID=MMETSP1096 /ASSEMBLY_ACC=CAM_ASM_000453 /LENGTH=60 /DNA_ID=CAMNT_0023257061 /DNA_START=845 /DNA_END=1024 /DNA_ORIENTATION=+
MACKGKAPIELACYDAWIAGIRRTSIDAVSRADTGDDSPCRRGPARCIPGQGITSSQANP